jgi:hypothetical protein
VQKLAIWGRPCIKPNPAHLFQQNNQSRINIASSISYLPLGFRHITAAPMNMQLAKLDSGRLAPSQKHPFYLYLQETSPLIRIHNHPYFKVPTANFYKLIIKCFVLFLCVDLFMGREVGQSG